MGEEGLPKSGNRRNEPSNGLCNGVQPEVINYVELRIKASSKPSRRAAEKVGFIPVLKLGVEDMVRYFKLLLENGSIRT